MALNFFRENEFLYKIEMMLQFHKLILVYLRPFVGDFAVKLAFARVCRLSCFRLKVWCQFHPHSSYQSFNGNCTTFTKGLSRFRR